MHTVHNTRSKIPCKAVNTLCNISRLPLPLVFSSLRGKDFESLSFNSFSGFDSIN